MKKNEEYFFYGVFLFSCLFSFASCFVFFVSPVNWYIGYKQYVTLMFGVVEYFVVFGFLFIIFCFVHFELNKENI